MATPFLSSEEYDERAHRLYDNAEYDTALETLKEGLRLYPDSVELHVGLGYTRLAREEFVWARHSFEHALVLDPEHEDAMVGLGEALLRFGLAQEALGLFERARLNAGTDDLDLMLSMGRALYRERLYDDSREIFVAATSAYPDSAEAAACLAYALHRLGDERGARRQLRRALRLDPELAEARIYMAHLLYDRGEWRAALKEFQLVRPSEHWDSLALWRVVELSRTLLGHEPGSAELQAWEARLEELESDLDPLEELLSELEGGGESVPDLAEPPTNTHRVRTPDGRAFAGSWREIVCQMRDVWGRPGESVSQFMRRHADEQRLRLGVTVPSSNAESFVRAIAETGMLRIEG
jgi:Tfp pilus assembly protein PilF